MSIEAMKQALEALGSYMEATDSEADAEAHSLMAAAFFKLKEAVAEAEKQEPVAWLFTDVEGTEFFEEREDWEGKWTPLYTTPPAAERNKVAQWMIAKGYATGHGDTTEDLLKELEWQVRESERNACAAIAKQWDADHPASNYGGCIANLIEARGQS